MFFSSFSICKRRSLSSSSETRSFFRDNSSAVDALERRSSVSSSWRLKHFCSRWEIRADRTESDSPETADSRGDERDSSARTFSSCVFSSSNLKIVFRGPSVTKNNRNYDILLYEFVFTHLSALFCAAFSSSISSSQTSYLCFLFFKFSLMKSVLIPPLR